MSKRLIHSDSNNSQDTHTSTPMYALVTAFAFLWARVHVCVVHSHATSHIHTQVKSHKRTENYRYACKYSKSRTQTNKHTNALCLRVKKKTNRRADARSCKRLSKWQEGSSDPQPSTIEGHLCTRGRESDDCCFSGSAVSACRSSFTL